jgi:hypothetical protein
MKKNYNMKKTISMKRFISELGENFSKPMKKRLLDLEIRCVLTRKEDDEFRLDLKHVEHLKYDGDLNTPSDSGKKEYVYGQFIVVDGELYFSEVCTDGDNIMESPIVDQIFNSLDSQCITFDTGIRAKKLDDNNMDYVIDSLLSVFPDVSDSYRAIVSGMLSRSDKKTTTNNILT